MEVQAERRKAEEDHRPGGEHAGQSESPSEDVDERTADQAHEQHELAPRVYRVAAVSEDAAQPGPESDEQPGERRVPVAVGVRREGAVLHGPRVPDIGAFFELRGRPMEQVGTHHDPDHHEQNGLDQEVGAQRDSPPQKGARPTQRSGCG